MGRSGWCLLATLSLGCTSPEERVASAKAEAERANAAELQLQQQDRSRCQSFGFPTGTVEFGRCVMQQDSQRREHAQQQRLMRDAERTNMRLVRQQLECAEAMRAQRNLNSGGFAGGFAAQYRVNSACQ